MTEFRWVLLVTALVIFPVVFLFSHYREKWQRLPRFHAAKSSEKTLQSHAVAPPLILPGKIITIRLLSPVGSPFQGEELVLALREAGLRHGRFGIFHRSTSPIDDSPLFSVASLTEPGSFDLTSLRTDVYQGVSLFLGLPGPGDGLEAFDAMLFTARSVAKKMNGNLVDEHGSTLSVQRERYLREEVIVFQHSRGRLS